MQNNSVLVVTGVAALVAVLYYLIKRKRSPVLKVQHNYFHRLWLWPAGSHTRWEAELDLKEEGVNIPVGFHSETTHEEVTESGPTDKEIEFCKMRIEHLDQLFELCKPSIEEAWKSWGKGELPSDWRTVLSLDGISVPRDGDIHQAWGVTYFCNPAGHYFNIQFRSGKPSLESVDG